MICGNVRCEARGQPQSSAPIPQSMFRRRFTAVRRMTYCCMLVLPGTLALNYEAVAAAYPTKPVRLIVPFPPGGGTDILARLIGQRLGGRPNVQFVVGNRPGAGRIID